MKTAGRRTPNCRNHRSGNRAHDAEGQNRSCSIKWAAKVEKFRPREECFFLTFPFIERIINRGAPVTALMDPVAFFLPEHAMDPSVRNAGEESWMEVTVP